MDIFSNLAKGFQTALTFQNIYLCFFGCLWGTIVGVLPGIGPLAGITLLIPATFGIDATGAIIMLAGIYSVRVNTPPLGAKDFPRCGL